MRTAGLQSHSRRSFIASLAAISATSLSGCLGDDDDSTPTATPSPSPTPTPSPDVTALEADAHSFVELLVAGEFDAAAAEVHTDVDDQLDAATLESAWTDVAAYETEVFLVYQSAYQGTEDGYPVIRVLVSREVGPQEVIVTLDPQERTVVGVFLPELPSWEPPAYLEAADLEYRMTTIETDVGCSLRGEVALPADGTDLPAVVVVHGSGPIDRDGTVGPNRTYRELARGLATHGIATLRYDKRSYACDIPVADITVDDVVTDDAVAAVDSLAAVDEVDETRIVVVGHSFGGTLAPRIADRASSVAAIAMLAPPARSMADLIADQQAHLLSLQDDLSETQRQEALDEVEALAEQIRTLDIEDDEVVNHLGGREYYASLQAYDHLEAAAELEVPIILQQGAMDWQVTVEDDLPQWEAAIGDDPSTRIETYDELDHRFQVAEDERAATVYDDPETPLDHRVIEDLAAFITESAG